MKQQIIKVLIISWIFSLLICCCSGCTEEPNRLQEKAPVIHKITFDYGTYQKHYELASNQPGQYLLEIDPTLMSFEIKGDYWYYREERTTWIYRDGQSLVETRIVEREFDPSLYIQSDRVFKLNSNKIDEIEEDN